ncbi:MAG: DUF4296 domain-containing protein [Bacteroidetes bacterium]|nr:DUF4296 domain-containing protein [Bacteroidota bacterium]
MWFRFTALLLIIAACGTNNTKDTHVNLLPEDQMISLLVDIHIAESAVQTFKLNSDSAKTYLRTYYRQIFEIHQIDPDDFFKSFDYYESNPKQFEKLYEQVMVEMSKKEALLNQKEDH